MNVLNSKDRAVVLKILLFALFTVVMISALLVYYDKLPSDVFTIGIVPGLIALLSIAIRDSFRQK